MTVDRSFIELNRASSSRLRALVTRLSDEELRQPVGRYWTVSTTMAHLAFGDLRVMHLLDATERDGKLCAPEIDIAVNDIVHPLLAAIPPRKAAYIAVETAEALDRRLEGFPSEFLEEIHARYERWIVRALHRNGHLDAIEAALGK
jgi:uncharacterized damage-inducible protein DinB